MARIALVAQRKRYLFCPCKYNATRPQRLEKKNTFIVHGN